MEKDLIKADKIAAGQALREYQGPRERSSGSPTSRRCSCRSRVTTISLCFALRRGGRGAAVALVVVWGAPTCRSATNATPGLSGKMISRVSNDLVLAGRKAVLVGQPDLVAQRLAHQWNREVRYQNSLPFRRQRSCKFASRHLLISHLAPCNRFDTLREIGVATLQPRRLL